MKPFAGVTVLDLTHVIAGPFCGHQLAMLGADVIKIEPPHRPDMTRIEGVLPAENEAQYGTYFQAQNAGKRAMTLDLRTAAGKDVMTRLVEKADVLVQNYAGEAIVDLGFGYEQARAINPLLIYCSLSGFGHTGPKADDAAYDVVIQAFSGIMSANGEHDWPPTRIGPPMVDYGTGAQAAMAISAALYQRDRTGTGQQIDVSMLDSALMLMSAMVVDTSITGDPPPPHGNAHSSYAGYATFDTAEGQLMIGAWTNEQLGRLLDLLGEPDRAAEVRDTQRSEIGQWQADDHKLVGRHLLMRTAAEWEDTLNGARVAASRVRSLDETLTEPQLASRPALQAVEPPPGRSGPPHYPVAGFSYAHDGPSVDRPPPLLGQHTDDVLAELGYDATQIADLRTEGAV